MQAYLKTIQERRMQESTTPLRAQQIHKNMTARRKAREAKEAMLKQSLDTQATLAKNASSNNASNTSPSVDAQQRGGDDRIDRLNLHEYLDSQPTEAEHDEWNPPSEPIHVLDQSQLPPQFAEEDYFRLALGDPATDQFFATKL